MERYAKLFWNLGVPVAGAMLFNIIGEMAHFGASAPTYPSDIDVSFGCAFAIVGVASAQPNTEKWRRSYGLFLISLLSSLLFDIILRYKFPALEWRMVVVSDLVAGVAAGYAMGSSGDTND